VPSRMVKDAAAMTRIDSSEVREIARLARLRLSEAEVERMARELGAILSHIEELRQLDTSAIEPMTHAVPFDCPLRPDEVGTMLPVEVSLQNAPLRDGPFFEVPRVVPDAGRDGEDGS
jgi:aspartyl-tRNA(Asn)/glutamyl-tRNA(Gln) amidotransferase subunit C